MEQVEQWFREKGWEAYPFQREVWKAYAAGESGLVHSPTGTGKSLAVWFGPLIEALESARPSNGLRVLWVTPLRALAADTAESLRQPVDDLDLGWTIGLRTGDSTATQKRRQRETPPEALVTTPESLSLLLSYPGAAEFFASLELVVVDEWHELMTSKRGILTQLSLAHLRALRPGLRIWGLSATLGNLDDALASLVGLGNGDVRPARLIRGNIPKELRIDALLPDADDKFPWSGYLGIALVRRVVEAIRQCDTSLIFTNTRSQSELWFRALTEEAPDLEPRMALHHGSMDQETRSLAELGLKDGSLRAVVATSSLDLGVDFAPVEQVLQIGSSKGVARLIQRAGRSGHQPGAVSRVLCVPTNTLELVEIAAARDLALQGKVEPILPIDRPLDVLCQHLLTLAAGDGLDPDQAFHEAHSTHAYAKLDRSEFDWALEFAGKGGKSLAAYPDYQRLENAEDAYRFRDEKARKRHRLMIGTIASDASINVKYLSGSKLGAVEESFLAKLKPGQRFLFAGRSLELVRIRDMTAYVRRTSKKPGAVPRWMGGKLPLSTQLADGVLARLERAAAGTFDSPEMERVRPILEIQRKVSLIPSASILLIEKLRSREGHHLFIYPFEGRLAHEGFSALCAYRLSRITPLSFTFAVDDYGFELLANKPIPIDEALGRGLFSTDNLTEDILASLNETELAKRRFREIARVAGLTFQGFPGAPKTARQLQISSGLLYDVFHRYEPENRLLRQARDEVLERELQQSRLRRALDRIADREIRIVPTARLSPLAFPLFAARLREQLSSETLDARLRAIEKDLQSTVDGREPALDLGG